MFKKFIVSIVVSASVTALAFADGFGHAPGHVGSRLETYRCHHIHSNAALLAQIRQEVHSAVRQSRPHAAVAPLKRIIALDPHDYHAWEFLSYTYAVLRDVGSAANVDLVTVALFQFVPGASPHVSRAASRLERFDPRAWRARVEAMRRLRYVPPEWGLGRIRPLPHIPIRAMDYFIDSIKTQISVEGRRMAYTKIEETLTTREQRVHVIEEWEHSRKNRLPIKPDHVNKCPKCREGFDAIARLR